MKYETEGQTMVSTSVPKRNGYDVRAAAFESIAKTTMNGARILKAISSTPARMTSHKSAPSRIPRQAPSQAYSFGSIYDESFRRLLKSRIVLS